jgi:hypothetical protein
MRAPRLREDRLLAGLSCHPPVALALKPREHVSAEIALRAVSEIEVGHTQPFELARLHLEPGGYLLRRHHGGVYDGRRLHADTAHWSSKPLFRFGTL